LEHQKDHFIYFFTVNFQFCSQFNAVCRDMILFTI